MKRIALIVGLVIGFAVAALADRVITLQSGQVVISNFDGVPLSDGGYQFRMFGYTLKAEDGGVVPLETNGVNGYVCTPGAWNGAPATCLGRLKVANNL